jgi:small subunit ribosomal protein S6e
MPFKLNISDKGKAWKVQSDSEFFIGKSLGETVNGKDISADLEGYELEITGGSDLAGFPLSKDLTGLGLKKLLLTKGFGMKDNSEGVRRKKTVRGKTISAAVALI